MLPAVAPTALQPALTTSLSATLGHRVEMTPALIARINQTHTRDSAFANLMRLAGSSKATPDQIRDLGVYIQTLIREVPAQPIPSHPSTQAQEASQTATTSTYHPIPPDLIIEFAENRNDRWLIPKDSQICNPQSNPGFGAADISLRVKLAPKWRVESSLPNTSVTGNPSGADIQKVVVNFHRTTGRIRSVISSRFGQITHVVPDGPRQYLQYRVRGGPLVTQLESLNSSKPGTKSIKPTPHALNVARRNTGQASTRKSGGTSKVGGPGSAGKQENDKSDKALGSRKFDSGPPQNGGPTKDPTQTLAPQDTFLPPK